MDTSALESLLDAVARRDPERLRGVLVRTLGRSMLLTCRCLCASNRTADAIFESTLVDLVRRVQRGPLDVGLSLRSWLCARARREVDRKGGRPHGRGLPLALQPAVGRPAVTGGDRLIWDTLVDRVGTRGACDLLLAHVLWVQEGWPAEEVAVAFDWSAADLEARYATALDALTALGG